MKTSKDQSGLADGPGLVPTGPSPHPVLEGLQFQSGSPKIEPVQSQSRSSVLPKKEKRPDQTGLCNTTQVPYRTEDFDM